MQSLFYKKFKDIWSNPPFPTQKLKIYLVKSQIHPP